MDAKIKRVLNPECSNIMKIITTYLLPTFQIAVVFINLLNAWIFSKWKKPLHKYLLLNSIIDTILFSLNILLIQPTCKIKTVENLTFWSQFFQLYFVAYLTKVAKIMSSLINIQIAFDRYFLIKTGISNKKVKHHIILLALIAFAYHTPHLLFFRIYRIEKSVNNTFFIVHSHENSSSYLHTKMYAWHFTEIAEKYKIIQCMMYHSYNLAAFVFLVIIHTLGLLIFKNYKKCKDCIGWIVRFSTTNSNIELIESRIGLPNSLDKNRITLLVLWMSCVSVANQISILLITLSLIFFGRHSSTQNKFLVAFLFFLTFLSLINVVFYYIFYRKYKRFVKRFCFRLSICLMLIIITFLYFSL